MRTAAFVILMVGLGGCQGVVPGARSTASTTAPAIVGRYAGSLPCEDCGGLLMELALHEEAARGPVAGRYDLIETYVGTVDGEQRFSSTGWWRLQQRTSNDPKATILELRDLADGYVQSFEVTTRGLSQLDPQGRPLDTTIPHVLQRKP